MDCAVLWRRHGSRINRNDYVFSAAGNEVVWQLKRRNHKKYVWVFPVSFPVWVGQLIEHELTRRHNFDYVLGALGTGFIGARIILDFQIREESFGG